jgi:Cu+-exporting ATPase
LHPRVEANVNIATERATITYDPASAGRAELVGAIEAAGYDVRPAASVAAADGVSSEVDDGTVQRERERREVGLMAIVSLGVAAGIFVLTMSAVRQMAVFSWSAVRVTPSPSPWRRCGSPVPSCLLSVLLRAAPSLGLG